MPGNYSRINPESPGNILTASNYNAEHDNHITNHTPAGLDDYSANATQSNAQSDPGAYGAETLATSTAEELEQLRYVISRIIGGDNDSWRDVPDISIKELFTGFNDNEIDVIRNLSLSLSAGTLTIKGQSGNLSATNIGYVSVRSTTAGKYDTINIVANATLNDDTASPSHMTGWERNVNAGADYGNALPLFIYLANKAGTDMDGTDGNSAFFVSANPCLTTTPSSANDIGDTSNIPVNDSKDTILLLGSYTEANYVDLPCRLIGAVRTTYLTSSHDWTILALGASDGIGETALDATFNTLWTMPTGQFGATAGSFLLANGGTPPTFTTNYCPFKINRDGSIDLWFDSNGNTATDGIGSVDLQHVIPFTNKLAFPTLGLVGSAFITFPGISNYLGVCRMDASASYFVIYRNGGTAVDYASFSDGARNVEGCIRYQAF